MSLLGIVLALVLLMVLVYRGWPVLLVAPAMALLAAAFDPAAPVLATYTQVFMSAFGGFVTRFFPLILLGAVFARLLDVTGSARCIADAVMRAFGPRRALLAVVATVALLAYGGLTVFAIIFAAYPVAAALFRRAGLPRSLIPATIVCGIFPAAVALPGAVQVFNAIPAPYFGTTAYAAPGYGLLAAAIMFGGGLAWLSYRGRRATADEPTTDPASTEPGPAAAPGPRPPLLLAVAPLVLVAVANLVFGELVLPRWQTDYLAEPRFGATGFAAVRGIWSMVLALAVGVAALIVLHLGRLPAWRQETARGAADALAPTFGVASEVGFGATIASLTGFAAVKRFVLDLSPAQPLVSEAVAVNLLAGITGSASGGLSVAMQIVGERYAQLAAETGLDPALLHRVATLSAAGLDSLPHSGGVIALLTICRLTHRQAYKDVAVVSVAIPLVATATVVLLGSLFATGGG